MSATLTRTPVRPGGPSLPIESPDMGRWMREILNRHAAVGFAVSVVRTGQPTTFATHGPSDVETGAPITPDTVFRIASISKTFTAIAVMQLWEDGLVDLDAPANDALRAYRLIPAKGSTKRATLRHLLTHTAGIPELIQPWDLLRPDWGDSRPLDGPLPTLAELYGGGIELHGEPGTVFTYSNHGFATLQQIVEDVSGSTFDRYLHERIFEPLGMTDTDLRRTERLAARLATGYEPGSSGPRRVTERAWTTPGASSVYSTTADMARYIQALLGGGANEQGRMLRPETLALMFAPHFRADPRVPGMGLGFDRSEADGHEVIGHGGILGARQVRPETGQPDAGRGLDLSCRISDGVRLEAAACQAGLDLEVDAQLSAGGPVLSPRGERRRRGRRVRGDDFEPVGCGEGNVRRRYGKEDQDRQTDARTPQRGRLVDAGDA